MTHIEIKHVLQDGPITEQLATSKVATYQKAVDALLSLSAEKQVAEKAEHVFSDNASLTAKNLPYADKSGRSQYSAFLIGRISDPLQQTPPIPPC